MAKKAKRKTGPARMRELGRTAVTIWLDEKELANLDGVRGTETRAWWAKSMVLHGIRQVWQTRKGA